MLEPVRLIILRAAVPKAATARSGRNEKLLGSAAIIVAVNNCRYNCKHRRYSCKPKFTLNVMRKGGKNEWGFYDNYFRC